MPALGISDLLLWLAPGIARVAALAHDGNSRKALDGQRLQMPVSGKRKYATKARLAHQTPDRHLRRPMELHAYRCNWCRGPGTSRKKQRTGRTLASAIYSEGGSRWIR